MTWKSSKNTLNSLTACEPAQPGAARKVLRESKDFQAFIKLSRGATDHEPVLTLPAMGAAAFQAPVAPQFKQ